MSDAICERAIVNANAVVSRDANSRVWEQTTYEQSPSGQITPYVHHYTELGTGLCYQQNGQWLDSQEQINILADGSAAATNGQHQAYFPADIYDGEITLVTADRLKLQSRPVGLSYDDGTNTVLIAELANSVGQLVAPNQAIYTNAFAGVDADLLYTYRKGSFEQDVIFRQQPPAPEQFGLNSANTRIQLLTEFFDPPAPTQSVSPVNPQDGLQDTTLSFGSMQMTHGRAFLAGQTSSLPDVHQISVYKSWVTIDGQTLLIEELPYERMAPEFQILPVPSSTVVSSVHSILHKVSSKRLLPPARLVEATTNSVQLAMADPLRKPGVVFDYITMNSGATNFTFQGDSTYFLSGECDFSGTTIFEGGTVVKMTNAPTIEGMISLNGPVVCQTGPYRPAIFTDMNDNSVGATITGSTGSPTFDDNLWCLWLNITNLSIHDVRFLYDFVAIAEGNVTSDEEVTNCQFINGDVAVDGNNVQLYNVLIGELPSVYSQITNSG